ncbi:MAG: phosphopentomutase [Negativicutes bacterium]
MSKQISDLEIRKRFIVLILDGYGIGATVDAALVRPQDVAAHTCLHIFEEIPELRLPNLEALGLANAVGVDVPYLRKQSDVCWGKSALMHFGADTFYGHQEIMGTLPKKPHKRPFSEILPRVREMLIKSGYQVDIIGEQLKYLLVNGCVTIADNIEADCGSAYNITATFDKITFAEVLAIGKIVREIADVSRVIAFGGEAVEPSAILAAAEIKEENYIGINAPLSGVYDTGYLVQHLGYGINAAVQVPKQLAAVGVKTILVGKVADIVENPDGESYSVVDTAETLEQALQCIKNSENAFVCINVQETDIAGHLQSAKIYAEKLLISDIYIKKIIALLNEDDVLLVTADHGNDPTIGHSQHTRENTPLLVFGKKVRAGFIGERKTLSDIGQTVCSFFDTTKCENGESFLKEILCC